MTRLAQHLVGYMEAKIDLAAATGYRKLMRVMAGMCWLVIIILVGLLALVCLTAAAGWAIGTWLGSRSWGLFCMGAMYVGVFGALFKKRRAVVGYFFRLLDSAVEKEETVLPATIPPPDLAELKP
ncbi:MAG: hypothetical protein RMM53_00185 [Bacteroidia bacterium]|nr:hypothetical protein [Bacteroidia bacterium]MDW8332612.1 hypothetical protein [Bacteroidia bacterium]